MKILLIFLLLASFDENFGAGVQKLFELRKWENCPGNLPVEVFVEVNQTNIVPNKMFYSGYFDVKEKISGPIEMTLEINRCDFFMKKCEAFSGMKLPGICGFLKDEKGLFYGTIDSFKPHLNCPLLPGKYESMNAVIDVSSFAPLPIDGYVWMTTAKVSSGEGKNRKLAMCLLMETKISLYKPRKRKN